MLDGPLTVGDYYAKRYTVERAVLLSGYSGSPDVYCRGVNANGTGWSDKDPNYGTGYCEVVARTATSATLRTYVYEMWSLSGTYLGWYPQTIQNVSLHYTVNGIPLVPLSVSISGPSSLEFKQVGTWTASTSGGAGGTVAYAWYTRAAGDPTWLYTGVTSSTYIATMGTNDFEVRVDATKGTQSASATRYVTYGSDCGGCLRASPDGLALVPDEYGIDAPRPNPFGAQTELRFALPEAARVRLAVYDVLGREVAVLTDGDVPAGTHASRFEAASLPAGVYLYRFEARGSTGTFARSGTVTLAR